MSEAFEDARSEVESQLKSPVRLSDSLDNIQVDKNGPKHSFDDDDLELPPLETFFDEIPELSLHPECVSLPSLAAELENDLFPSTPLTEDQLRHADSVLQDELKQNGVPINQINESDGDEEYLGHDIKGVMAFLGLAGFFMSRPLAEIQLEEKLVFMCFFAGAIVCMGLSFLYHTLCCHKDKKIGRLFAKFDYCGIAFLTVGSFVPWLYYSFYCDRKPQIIYLSIVIGLGIGAVVVSTFDFFAGPRFRPLRAGVFITFGLSGIAPATHFGYVNGWQKSIDEAAIPWLILMGILYITGALLYAMRIPERFFPGKVDIWFHSHQIFHCFVIAGAIVHYHGISLMAMYRLKIGECPLEPFDRECIMFHTA